MKQFFTFLFIAAFVPAVFGQCWQKVASKYDHVIAIHLDGTLWHWGGAQLPERPLKTPTLFDSDTTWTDIATGNGFIAAIKSNGTLWVWGDNSFGQLGVGNTTNQWTLIQMGTATDWKQVSCGLGHMAALKTDGTLWVWGRNNYGQLGTGISRTNSSVPAQLGTDTDWEYISAGRYHTLAKKTNSSLYFVGACYGSQVSQLNQTGPAGVWQTMAAGTSTDYAIRVNGTLWKWTQSNGAASGITQVGTATNWLKTDNSQSYTTETHALFVKTDGTLWSIGANQFGQLGDGTTIAVSTPVQIGSASGWKNVIAGNTTSFAQRQDLTFWGWGRNQLAQFGDGKNRNIPQPIEPADTWKSVSVARGPYNNHVLAIRMDGTLWAWGQNNDGQLGIGSTYTHKALPVQVGTDTSWRVVSNGFHFSVGIKSDGTLWTWGRNGRGQLGLGQSYFSRTVPTQVGTDTSWLTVAAGAEFVLALKSDSTLWAWGYNAEGQLGNGSPTDIFYTPVQIGTDTSWRAISAGERHSMALRIDSTLWTWGSNQHGQLGRAGITNVPMQVGTAVWKSIGAGGLHSLGIQADSSLWAWGRNLYAQLGDNTTNNHSSPTPIAAAQSWAAVIGGYEHSVAIHSDGTLWAWGRNAAGQVADTVSYLDFLSKTYTPTQVGQGNSWKIITAGTMHSEAITASGSLLTWGDGYSAEYQTNFPVLGYVHATPVQLNSCSYCPPTYGEFDATICQGDSLLFNGIYRLQAGDYPDTLVNAAGCDSIVTMHLAVLQPATGTDVRVACESYDWIDGNTYVSSNSTATFTIAGGAANGCDSIVTLDLTILQPATGTDVRVACESYDWIDGNTYASSNSTATFTIAGGAANGCDSIVTLNLTILQPATGTDVRVACESYDWIDGNTYVSSTSTATFTIAGGAANGCDSIVTLDLTILEPTFAVFNDSYCGENYTWPVNGETYAAPGTYTDTLVNASGCDSIVTLNLVLNTVDVATTSTGVVIAANANNALYQWLDCDNGYATLSGQTGQSFTATENGNYAVAVTQNGCTDTSACTSVTTVGLGENAGGNGFIVFPNPTSGTFRIIFNEQQEHISVQLRSLTGQAVGTWQFEQTDSIDLQIDEAAGVYLLEISGDAGTTVLQRLMVR